jgi:hypothetical protein
MIGGWPTAQKIGSIVELYNKIGFNPTDIVPCCILSEATKEEYLTQQQEAGRLESELQQSWSIVNTAKFFYRVSID